MFNNNVLHHLVAAALITRAVATGTAPPSLLTRKYNYVKFGLCQGQCQKDSQCTGDLKCYSFYSGKGTKIPGCTGEVPNWTNGRGYCVDPKFVNKQGRNNILEIVDPTLVADTDTLVAYGSQRNWGEDAPPVKFGTCVGGCGSDTDCRSGLKCGEKNSPVPSCKGTGLPGWSYCYDSTPKVAAAAAAAGTLVAPTPTPTCVHEDCKDWDCSMWCECFDETKASVYTANNCDSEDGDSCDCPGWSPAAPVEA